jgi:hypothetical protein
MTTVDPLPAQTKCCTKCKQVQPVDNFTKKRSAKDGMNPWCRTCWGSEKREVRAVQLQRIRNPLARSQKRRTPLTLVPLEPVVREVTRPARPAFIRLEPAIHEEEPIWVREERKFEEPKQPAPERIDPEFCRSSEPPVTHDELLAFVQDFIVRYLVKYEETPYPFFKDWLRYQYPELSAEFIENAHRGLIRRKATVIRTALVGGEPVVFVRLPGQQARRHAESWRDDLDSSEAAAVPKVPPDSLVAI